MITRKRCVNCASYIGWECESECVFERENWTPKHGEWISTKLCRPNDGEFVAIIQPWGEIECAVYKERVHAFVMRDGSWMHSQEDVIPWWMRFEEMPPDER